jgi:hypothetical protein
VPSTLTPTRAARPLRPVFLALLGALLGGCPQPTPPSSNVFNNTTDPTNGGATLIGQAACSACHPGIAALFQQHDHNAASVNCESCHGPGSKHIPNPAARNIFADSTINLCARCHTGSADPNVIPVANGYIAPLAQVAELRASGGHSTFACGVCHDPHASARHDRADAIRNACPVCHIGQNRAFHEPFTLVLGNITEKVDCPSCHMPLTGVLHAAAGPDVVGTLGGRAGDERGHIFRIDTQHATIADMFSADGTHVVKDAEGRAAVTPDFACLRCHNGLGSAFVISAQGADVIGTGMHTNAAAAETTEQTPPP